MLFGACATPPNPSTSPSTVAPTPAPTGTTTPSLEPTPEPTDQIPEPSPDPPDDAWGALDLPPLVSTASLEPTKQGAAGAAVDTAFRLRSLDGTPVAELASALVSEPPVALRAEAPKGDTVILRPATALAPGATYRFKLLRDDGTLAGSWGITAAKPLHVVGTLPGDRSTEVPRNTGIEIRFDQSGITADALKSYFSISPEVDGRFEVHGRVVAFVPSARLKPFTIYTLTVRRGLPLPGTGQVLESDVVARFETTSADERATRMYLPAKLADSGTRDKPVLGVTFYRRNGDAKVPATLSVRVHRLGDMPAAITAYGRLVTTDDWARSGGAPIDTAGLPETLRATIPVRRFSNDDGDNQAWVRLPTRLAAGWYIATFTFSGQRHQALIQVTDVATYAMVTQTQTAVWTNDVRTGKAIAAARLTLGSAGLGQTNADGLRTAPTPASAKTMPGDTRALVLKVDAGAGRTMFVPVDRRGVCYYCHDFRPADSDDIDAWWHVLALDRNLFRPTDAANVWGIVRARDGGALPKALEVSLAALDEAWNVGETILTERPKPAATGAYIAKIAFRDLPPGQYRIQVRAEGTLVDEAWMVVGPIVKPGYTLSITPSKRAVLAGGLVTAAVQARFFEGTPVAGADLWVGFDGYDDRDESPTPTATTALDGTASATIRAPRDLDEYEQWQPRDVTAIPTLPEEASIGASEYVSVFRSTALLRSDATLAGSRLTVSGTVNDVAFARLNAPGAAVGYDIDPYGAPRTGATVHLVITEVLPIARKTGTEYDFITKTTTPVYDYTERLTEVAQRNVKTSNDGTFRLSLNVKAGKRYYRVVASYRDEVGREITADAWAYGTWRGESDGPYLAVDGNRDSERQYSVGDQVRVVLRGGHPNAPKDRYLFLVSQRGLGFAAVQPGPVFTTLFREASVPSKQIDGVRFTGTAYEVAGGFTAGFRTEDRRLNVTITPDATRYEPGGRVEVNIRTTDLKGRPVAASVVVRAIDEKLYAIQAASDIDPLHALYGYVSNGQIGTAWSHKPPRRAFEGGDTTGGGDDGRSDFRDFLVFRLVQTGADGRAKVGFDLSDDLTSWRVSAGAVDRALRAGTGTARIPVGLPFFVEATLAAEYLVADRPILRLRGYGSALSGGDAVTFAVSSPSLGMAATKGSAAAFTAAQIPLPALKLGDHEIRIEATSGTGAAQRRDVLIRTIRVVLSRSVQARNTSQRLDDDFVLTGGTTGLTTVLLSDAGRGRVLPLLLSLTGQETARADEAIASELARRVLLESFGSTVDAIGMSGTDLAAFQSPGGGVALLPYDSTDLELSVLAAFADDPRIDPVGLARLFAETIGYSEVTRDRRIMAVAGQAALGEPVRDLITAAAAEPTLIPRERAWLALAAMAAGDEALARRLERALLRDHGQRLGPWVRLTLKDRETSITTTAILAIVAAGIGDPIATDLDAYLDANPPKDTLLDLHRALAARAWVERTPGESAAASLTVDGATRQLTIEPDAPVWLTFTPAQVPTVRLATTSGRILVSTRWEGPLDASSLKAAGEIRFERRGAPTRAIAADATVSVDFTVELGTDPGTGCWVVTDLVPSGLAPIASSTSWYDDEDARGTEGPWRITGQRVEFCVTFNAFRPVHRLHYIARVVTPGSYRWEPAILQSSLFLERGIVLRAFDLQISSTK